MRGSDYLETYGVRIDGTLINLNEWIANGWATFSTGGSANHLVTPSGDLSVGPTGVYNDGSVGNV